MHLYVLSVVLKNLLLLLFCTIWQWCEELHLHEDLWSLGLNCNSVSCVQGWKGKSSQEKDGGSKPSVSWISSPKVSWPRTLSLGALPGALQLTQSGMMIWECVSSQKSYDISSCDWYYQAMGVMQEGAFGLLKSTEKFDGNRRTKFSSYAFFWIQEVGAFPFGVFIAQCFPKLWQSFVSMPLSLGVCLFRDKAKWNEAYPHKLIAAWMRVLDLFCCYNVSWVLAKIMTWVILFHSTTEVFTHCIQDLTPQFVTLQRMAAAAKKFRHVLRIGRPVYQTASLILQQKDVSSWISCTLFRSV